MMDIARTGQGATVVDLFCGCGGLSLGAELAGFRSLVAIDVDGTLQSAYRRNFPASLAVEANVADIEAADWRQFIGSTRPDGVIGGPPCQGFSFIGKRRRDDPRNSLLFHFYRHVELLRPKFFLMENVEGLIHGENSALLEAALEPVAPYYSIVGPIVVTASEFGAATSRRRVVVFGYDPQDVDPVHPTFLDSVSGGAAKSTVRDAIADLPSPAAGGRSDDFGWASYPEVPHLSTYAGMLRQPPPPGLGRPDARARQGENYVSGMTETRHSHEISKRYASIQPGRTDPITKSYRLEWEGQCPTLRAGTGAERGAFQAVRPIHPEEGRVITVREAARLQGFPDWFMFHETKWHSFRMIGNSVPPPVSHGILSKILPKIGLPLAA